VGSWCDFYDTHFPIGHPALDAGSADSAKCGSYAFITMARPQTHQTMQLRKNCRSQLKIGTDKNYKAVSPPLYLSSTYGFHGFEDMGQYDYGRSGNPNRDALGNAISDLEGGAGGIVTSSGMAAIELVTNLLTSDELILAPHDCYGGTHRPADPSS